MAHYVLDITRTCRLVEEMLDKIGATLETLRRKPVRKMQQQIGMSRFLPLNGIQLHPYITQLFFTNPRVLIMRQKLVLGTRTFGSVCGDIYSTLILFSIEAWFHLGGYVNLHNNSYWSAEIFMFIHSVL